MTINLPHARLRKARTGYKLYLIVAILLIVFVGIIAGLFYWNRSYPNFSDYVLNEDVAIMIQYHKDFWENEATPGFNHLFGSTNSPLEFAENKLFQNNQSDSFHYNLGLVLIIDNNDLSPVYFLEIDNLETIPGSIYPAKIIDDWLVLSPSQTALDKIKKYAVQKIDWPNQKIWQNPNIRMHLAWDKIIATQTGQNYLKNYFGINEIDEYTRNALLHIPKLLPDTNLVGDFTEHGIKLRGYSPLTVNDSLPITPTQAESDFQIPYWHGKVSFSLIEPLNRAKNFYRQLTDLHHLYGLSIGNYFQADQFESLLKDDAIRRWDLILSDTGQIERLNLWLDSDYSWLQIFEITLGRTKIEREYTLPDGTIGKEFVLKDSDITYDEESKILHVNDEQYDLEVRETSHYNLLELSFQKLPAPDQVIEINNQDILAFPFSVEEQNLSLVIQSITSFDRVNYEVSIKSHE